MLKAAEKIKSPGYYSFYALISYKTKKMKNMFLGLGNALSREQAKKVIGGGTCCAHSADWRYQSCNLSSEVAQARAAEYAMETGFHGYWCCSSCPQTPQ